MSDGSNPVSVGLERLSDVFFPRSPLIARRADKLKFMFNSSKSGLRGREVVLHAITVSDTAEIIFNCLCLESDEMKSFRFSRIASDIECEGGKYSPGEFITGYLGLSEEYCRAALEEALGFSYIREHFDRFLSEQLGDSAPVWTGNAALELKFKNKRHTLTLKSVFLLPPEDYYFWGYSEQAAKFMFIPLAVVEGKITADGKGYQRKTFLPKFLGLTPGT